MAEKRNTDGENTQFNGVLPATYQTLVPQQNQDHGQPESRAPTEPHGSDAAAPHLGQPNLNYQKEEHDEKSPIINLPDQSKTNDPTTVKKPASHIFFAVFAFLCCNPITGIPAIAFSIISRQAARKGNYTTAGSYGKVSLVLSIIGVVTGFILAVFGIISAVTTYLPVYWKHADKQEH